MSDHKGARLMLAELPKAQALIGDRGYDGNWFRAALKARGNQKPKGAPRLRQDALPNAPQNRKPVRQTQRLAARRYALRPMRPRLLFGNLHRSRRLARDNQDENPATIGMRSASLWA